MPWRIIQRKTKQMSNLHEELMFNVVKLSSDYKPFGKVERWENENEEYPDCSMGCKHYRKLEGELGFDWGVCVNRNSKRFAFLTFEHQAGKGCYEK